VDEARERDPTRARLAVESRATRAVDSSDASEARAVDGRRAIDRSIRVRLIR
jgi:hypothetical protein